ncbi:MAG: YfcE family phosphodiesterase [Treponema sp.]|nr:YfcE family phosphodiesterase [Candidatus Treponema equi]
MNNFLQEVSYLLGSEEEIKNLALKEKARILVLSDSHGSYANLRNAITDAGSGCDAMIFCGDGINDIARLAEECLDSETLAQCVPPVIGVVVGNNDPDIYPIRGFMAKVPVVCTMDVAGHKIFFTHGHRFSLYDGTEEMRKTAESMDCTAVFYGHTHVACEMLESGNIFTLNPGSCARPRCGLPNSYAIVEVDREHDYYNVVFYKMVLGGSSPFIPKL